VELLRRGHEVVLMGLRGSKLDGALEVIEGGGDEIASFVENREKLTDYLRHGEAVVCDHSWLYSSVLLKRDSPEVRICHVHHGPLYNWGSPPPVERPCLMGVSRFHAFMLSAELDREHRFVYNGIDLEHYPLNEGWRSDRVLFLNRIDPVKGAHIAVYMARRWGWKLDVVGGTRLVPSQDYVHRVMSRCGGEVRFWGEVDEKTKIRLLREAKSLIAPIAGYEEPFGIFCCEAMACGTPVVVLRRGALPELVRHGKTGFLADSWDDFRYFYDLVDGLSPRTCREWVERNFSREVMCDGYVNIYKELLDGKWW